MVGPSKCILPLHIPFLHSLWRDCELNCNMANCIWATNLDEACRDLKRCKSLITRWTMASMKERLDF